MEEGRRGETLPTYVKSTCISERALQSAANCEDSLLPLLHLHGALIEEKVIGVLSSVFPEHWLFLAFQSLYK